MKHALYLILLFGFFSSCAKVSDGFRDLKTGETTCWNLDGYVERTADEIVLKGIDSRAVTTTSYTNFELELECKTSPGALGGIFFHTDGFDGLKKGYEVFINNDERIGEWRKTGSLTAVRNFGKCVAYDDEWTPIKIAVSRKNIRVYINDLWIVDYTQPAQPFRLPDYSQRLLSSGVFVLVNYSDADIAFRNIRVKPVLSASTNIADAIDEQDDDLIRLHQQNFPLIDTHLHLKGGLTAEDVDELTRKYGITYGVAPNCGLNFPITNDRQIYDWLKEMKGHLFQLPMQAEGREWTTLFSDEAVRSFDYVFTDALTWSDDKGRRMRIWIPEETFIVNKERFMDTLVDNACTIITTEDFDLFVNPTFLPQELQTEYNELWTKERMERVIDACTSADVAIEINCRYRIPSQAFIELAKEKGAKFSIGTNNEALEDIDQLAYAIEMIKACELTAANMYIPISKNK